MTAASQTVIDNAPIQLESTESAASRRARLSTGGLLLLLGALMAALGVQSSGSAGFALSDAFAAVQLPTLTVPALPTVLACAALTLLAGAGFVSGRLWGRSRTLAATVAGVAVTLGFVTWAAAGSAYAFPVANQLSGTVALATPLVLGALAGALCENAGVVNVAIEGQFLVAAFTAATVGSVTGSITVALLAAVLAGVAMGALLAAFSIDRGRHARHPSSGARAVPR